MEGVQQMFIRLFAGMVRQEMADAGTWSNKQSAGGMQRVEQCLSPDEESCPKALTVRRCCSSR